MGHCIPQIQILIWVGDKGHNAQDCFHHLLAQGNVGSRGKSRSVCGEQVDKQWNPWMDGTIYS